MTVYAATCDEGNLHKIAYRLRGLSEAVETTLSQSVFNEGGKHALSSCNVSILYRRRLH